MLWVGPSIDPHSRELAHDSRNTDFSPAYDMQCTFRGALCDGPPSLGGKYEQCATKMIELGLSRISQLVKYTPLTWKAIHIAGTNGKGSVASYLSSLLKRGKIRTGRFTSPHLIDRWDCIVIDEETVAKPVFDLVESEV